MSIDDQEMENVNLGEDDWSDKSFCDENESLSSAKRFCSDKRKRDTDKKTSQRVTKSSTTSSTIINVPVQNRYNILTPADVNNESQIILNRQQNGVNDTKKERIPPITLRKTSRTEVSLLCNGLNITKYSIKPIDNSSVNIYLTSVDDFKRMRKHVAESQVAAFTHNLQSELSFRVVLKGLYLMEPKDLKDELSRQNIVPDDITIIPLKKRRYDDQAMYLLYFKKGTTNINELRKCQFLLYMRIDWELYSPRSNGPVRCRRCQAWGHGCKNCWLPVSCMYCAGDHTTNECKEIVNGVPVRKDFVPRCANCTKEHPANYEKCDALLKHMERQASLALKNSRLMKSRNRSIQHKDNHVMNPVNPTIPRPVYSFNNPARPSYAHVTKLAGKATTDPESQLMTANELLSLTKELISSLKNCRTREQQFDVMAALAIKYVYGNGCP